MQHKKKKKVNRARQQNTKYTPKWLTLHWKWEKNTHEVNEICSSKVIFNNNGLQFYCHRVFVCDVGWNRVVTKIIFLSNLTLGHHLSMIATTILLNDDICRVHIRTGASRQREKNEKRIRVWAIHSNHRYYWTYHTNYNASKFNRKKARDSLRLMPTKSIEDWFCGKRAQTLNAIYPFILFLIYTHIIIGNTYLCQCLCTAH